MKTLRNVLATVLVCASVLSLNAQPLNPAERRALKEYTSPDELVSIAPTTPLNRALSAISEVSKKFVGKIVIDPERRDTPIGVDISGMQWRVALETICRKLNLWYEEYPEYFQIISLEVPDKKREGTTAGGTVDIQKEVASIKSRQI